MFLATHQHDRDLVRRAVHRKVACHFIATIDRLRARGFKFNRGILFGIEVIGLSQVFVTRFVGGVHAVGFDRKRESRLGRILSIDRKFPGDVIEPTVNPADVEMSCFKTDGRMNEVVIIFVRSKGGRGVDA